VFLLVGLPASGKSTFSTIVEDQINNIVRINQDEMRSKKHCEDVFSQNTKKGKTVIVDLCNMTKAERKAWMDMNLGKGKVWFIYFNATAEECKWRIAHRKDHPTVRAEGGARIVGAQAKRLEEPTIDEGFDKLLYVPSFKESNQLLLKFGCDISGLKEENHDNIIKFPRTRHLANLGSATRDDLLLSKEEIKSFLNTLVYVEEKIDGANLGISIKDYKLVAQNRSHYVNSGYHAQFKLLDQWLMDHSADLWTILEDENHILYGEWVYAKHSIPYDNLPDYFIAFDLYDKAEGRFYSRERLEAKLEGTSIKLIPIIKHDKFKSDADLVKLVHNKSKFYDGEIEGLYVRRCNDRWLEERAKIVRSDFICGDDHWSKGILTKNKLAGY
jgi:atypical dual specificity phosphatase